MRPPETIPAATLDQLWDEGMPLAAATLALEIASGRRYPESDQDARTRTPCRPADERATISRHLNALARAWAAQERQRESVRADVSERLARGALMAIGVVRADRAADRREVVPCSAWTEAGAPASAISWEKSSVTVRGREYADVRLVDLPAPAAARGEGRRL